MDPRHSAAPHNTEQESRSAGWGRQGICEWQQLSVALGSSHNLRKPQFPPL